MIQQRPNKFQASYYDLLMFFLFIAFYFPMIISSLSSIAVSLRKKPSVTESPTWPNMTTTNKKRNCFLLLWFTSISNNILEANQSAPDSTCSERIFSTCDFRFVGWRSPAFGVRVSHLYFGHLQCSAVSAIAQSKKMVCSEWRIRGSGGSQNHKSPNYPTCH